MTSECYEVWVEENEGKPGIRNLYDLFPSLIWLKVWKTKETKILDYEGSPKYVI